MHTERGTRPKYMELTWILESKIRSLSRVFVVFDAFDECPAEEDTRIRILLELRSLPKLKVMATGRPHVRPIVLRLGDISELEIRARDKDIDEQRIHFNENLSPHCLKDQKLEEKIRKTVVEKAAGM